MTDDERNLPENPEHLQKVILKHGFCTDYFTETDKPCDGEVCWDEGLEGYVCNKCNLYTGVK